MLDARKCLVEMKVPKPSNSMLFSTQHHRKDNFYPRGFGSCFRMDQSSFYHPDNPVANWTNRAAS
jgi:hypothetical protein